MLNGGKRDAPDSRTEWPSSRHKTTRGAFLAERRVEEQVSETRLAYERSRSTRWIHQRLRLRGDWLTTFGIRWWRCDSSRTKFDK